MAARSLVSGSACAPLVWTDMPLSFWGGIDPASGLVIDRHHPLCGRSVAGRVLALPDGRGSCTGSTVMLELLLGAHAPAALVLSEPDEILTLGVLVAQRLFGRSIPVVLLDAGSYAHLAGAGHVALRDVSYPEADIAGADLLIEAEPMPVSTPELSGRDRALLAGEGGEAARVAMEVIVRMAELLGASRLVDITRTHVDACIYTGPASLRFARHMRDLGGRFAVPTTLNAISVDRCGWRAQGVPPQEGEPADALAQAYLDMGAQVSFTCAPYHLPTPPALGEHIAWAESNAVMYANSVLGARTAKYPDFLEVLAGLTGRAPEAGCHLDAPRQPVLRLRVEAPGQDALTEDFYALAGYAAGLAAGRRVPLIEGMAHLRPSDDDLRAFCAAFATTSSAPMCHIAGVTPEARLGLLDERGIRETRTLDRAALRTAWRELNGEGAEGVDLVALGNPHFSADEFAELARLCAGRRKDENVALVVTTSRHVAEQAGQAGHLQAVRDFGALVVQDTCWCMLREPVVPPAARVIATSSAKYAHYAGGLVGRRTRLSDLPGCVQAACSGRLPDVPPRWLDDTLSRTDDRS